MNILALDIGTSSVKAAVLDVETGRPQGGIVRAEYALDAPCPEAAEVPAERLWQSVASAARAAVRHADVAGQPGRDVAGVGLSCMTPALVLLDKADRPLRPIWTHLDRRARPAARQAWAAVGAEFLHVVGNRPLPGGISVLGYRHMLTEHPYLIQEVGSYLHANGWLAFHMTGTKAFDPANASFTGVFGTMTDRAWSKRWCDYFEVDSEWLPPVVDGAATVGALRSQAAAELGVPGGIPVKIGTADTSCAVLAADMAPGDLLHEVGTTQVLAVLTDKPAPSPQRLTRLFGVGKSFVHVAHNPVGGVALEWMHRLCFREQSTTEFFEQTVPQALERQTRVSLDPPFLGGDRLEIEAHRAAFRDLELASDRLDLLAGVLQAMVLRHQQAVAALGQATMFRRIFLSGRGADLVHKLLPEYRSANVQILEEGSLRGVVRLFS
ncbi:MAG: FGGY-family carbohydrate kinase [Planctomycetes bacterium]|nr:FGGY-family carbohydrate kinase [Planctomycetota bacterium]